MKIFLPLVLALPLAAQTDSFAASVKPFLKNYCATCHASKVRQANLDLEVYLDEKRALGEHELWERVIRKVRAGEMPPKALPQPKPELKEAALHWFEERIAHHDRAKKIDPGRVTARRLNRAEYNNTVRDLTGIDLRLADEFPVDDSGYGFDNNGDVLTLSPVLMEKYLSAADRIVRAILPRDLPKRITMDRYEPEKAGKPEKPAIALLDEAFAVRHSFPAEAEYEIRANLKLRQGPATAPYRLTVLVDGQPLKQFDLEAGITVRHFDARATIAGGLHEVALGFAAENGATGNSEFYFDNLEIRGPYNPKPPAPGEAYKRLFVCAEQSTACAGQVLAGFARRAWRRPVTAEETKRLSAFYEMARAQGDSFDRAVGFALKAVLVSPHFLFRIEKHPNPTDAAVAVNVTDVELASRLSYFVWSSMPDEALLSLAERNELRKPGVLAAQVKRMLADPRSAAFAENFAGQWLEVRNVDSLRPDPKTFPTFDRALREAIYRETILFFEAMLKEDRSILDFIDGKFTFVNDRLAKHYGIPNIKGKDFQRVELDGTQRSGVLTHASVLAVTSYPTRTSPVQRGLWVLENFLGTPPPPPPPNVPQLNEQAIGKQMSLREQLEKHRADPSCAVCHDRMDALGFGLENYDAVGQWRTEDGSFPVDTKGTLPGGRSFVTSAELKQILRDDAPTFAHALAEKMTTYALGRGVEPYDKPALRKLVRDMAASQYRISSMIMGIVESPAFQMRRGDPGRRPASSE